MVIDFYVACFKKTCYGKARAAMHCCRTRSSSEARDRRRPTFPASADGEPPIMTRHVLATLTLFFTLLALTACRNDTSSADMDSLRELRYAATKDIRDINPHLYTGEMAAQAMVFEPLVSNTPEGIRPCLAESWDISDDGRVYTFHLRRDVRFSDGEAFNAAAVKQNMALLSDID